MTQSEPIIFNAEQETIKAAVKVFYSPDTRCLVMNLAQLFQVVPALIREKPQYLP